MYFTSHANALGVCAADGAHLYHFKSLTKDRQPVIDLLYDKPNDAGTGEDCARVILPEVKINDGPCSGGARFVCQIDF
nr:hypothetical protein BaRGS_021859 [Batillaria attramentaria]